MVRLALALSWPLQWRGPVRRERERLRQAGEDRRQSGRVRPRACHRLLPTRRTTSGASTCTAWPQWRGGNRRDAAMVELLAATGLRASEIAGLKVGDLAPGERSGWVTVRGKGRKQRLGAGERGVVQPRGSYRCAEGGAGVVRTAGAVVINCAAQVAPKVIIAV